MSLINCKECKNQVSNQAEKCPHCGATIKKRTGCGTIAAALILFFVAFGGFISAYESTQPQPVKTPQQLRAEEIEKHFDAWNGSHIGLTATIKSSLNDPESYQHDKTTYIDKVDHLIITTIFRAKNQYGGITTYQIVAQTNLDGEVLQIMTNKIIKKL